MHFRDSIYLSDKRKLPLPPVAPVTASTSANDRRSQLLKRKLDSKTLHPSSEAPHSFDSMLESEILSYKKTLPIEVDQNPLAWWRDNHGTYPLLAKYVKSNGAFQATSVASERIFNVDKLVYDERRKSLEVERGSGLVIAQDYLQRRKNPAEFRLCTQCPAPQSKGWIKG